MPGVQWIYNIPSMLIFNTFSLSQFQAKLNCTQHCCAIRDQCRIFREISKFSCRIFNEHSIFFNNALHAKLSIPLSWIQRIQGAAPRHWHLHGHLPASHSRTKHNPIIMQKMRTCSHSSHRSHICLIKVWWLLKNVLKLWNLLEWFTRIMIRTYGGGPFYLSQCGEYLQAD